MTALYNIQYLVHVDHKDHIIAQAAVQRRLHNKVSNVVAAFATNKQAGIPPPSPFASPQAMQHGHFNDKGKHVINERVHEPVRTCIPRQNMSKAKWVGMAKVMAAVPTCIPRSATASVRHFAACS